MRADARRNRDRVMSIARALFEQHGPSVEMDEIARQAGVGVGTIYRQFPTKEALMQAVLASHIERVTIAARELAAAPDAGKAFFDLLARIASEFLVKGSLHLAMARAGLTVPEPTEERAEFERALGALLVRAQKAGAVRRGVTAPEVIMLARGALFPSDAHDIPTAMRRRMFEIVCNGLRTRPRR
jgi:AcrR family transcriptional regulator